MFSGNIISLTGNWHDNPLLSLSETEKTHFRERGWTIVPLSGFYTYYPYDYSRESSSTIGGSGERNAIAAKIGGSSEENARYPFNTLLITDDMLLHVYHKLFDNGLKYYEEKIARPTLVKLAEKLYKQYLSASDDPDNNYAEIYQFLAAYRAVPHIFLPTNDDIIAAVDDKNFDYESGNPDLTDAEITQMIQKRTQTIAKTLAPTYQKLIPQIVEKILQADEPLA
ncbi:MAG: DUF3160 domain-containing protein [Candidatus Peribacteria bacterium]|jgi:hypothetical protein|nr:DUF3160 domain-containing protein [Candidatus Peribacteria bacterium]